MEFILMYVGISIAAWIGYVILKVLVRTPGISLQSKFNKLVADSNGVIAGKTFEEIKRVCGQPSAVSSIGNGKTLKQWQATGYHLALVFDSNDVCEGVSTEVSV